MATKPGEDPKKCIIRIGRNVCEQTRTETETPEDMANAYIINRLADKYGTQSQLLDSNNVVIQRNIDSMIAARYERL